jgi:hypothetical protein
MPIIERIQNFVASATPDVLIFDPSANNPKSAISEPNLPEHATYDVKSVSWVVPAGRPVNIKVEFFGIKAHSVFISMPHDPIIIQLYKGESNGQASRQISTHYINPTTIDQEYVLTTASKDTSGRESGQPWWNNHPLGAPVADGYQKKTVWETDDSRSPGEFANITVTWYHDYPQTFNYIE